MSYLKVIFLFLIICLFFNNLSANNYSSEELIKLQKKTILIHNNLNKLQNNINVLNIEINKNKQSQLIFKKQIQDEEILGQKIIFLIQEQFYSNVFTKYLNKYPKNNNFITRKVISKFYFDSIKKDISSFIIDLEKVEKLDKKLQSKIFILNDQMEKLKGKKKILEVKLKEKLKLQKTNPKNKLYKRKAKTLKKTVKNLNDLVSGVSKNKNKKIKKKKSKKVKFPVNGQIVSNFGEIKDEFPLKNGLMFELVDDPYIIAPINGTVVFSGQFRSYGNIIIIENNDFYHTILSGMDEILIASGNEVLRGEPIAKNYLFKNETKKIYFELRFKGKPIDPKREVEIL